MPPKKAKAKLMAPEAVGLGEASEENYDAYPGASTSPADEESTQGNQQVLTAIASLEAKLT